MGERRFPEGHSSEWRDDKRVVKDKEDEDWNWKE
jgi:hypothetical protein